MLKNFTLLFLRNLRRQKLFSAINLLGLTVSMASTLLIYLYVRHEMSYDNFHEGADRIYRVNQTFIWAEKDNHQFGSTGPGVAFALKEELPEIELISRLHTQGDQIVTWHDGKGNTASFVETRIVTVDSNFFRMFSFPMIKGNPATALTHARTIVLSESMAKKYFGDQDPIGQVLKVGTSDDQKDFEVTGVVKDRPGNTYIEFDMLLSMASFPVINRMSWSWVWTQLETYIRVKPGTDIENTRAKLALIPRKHAEQTLRTAMNVTYDEYVKSGKKWELFLQPLMAIHLPPDTVYNRVSTSGNIVIVYALIGAAVFILLLSCVNFMNLSTAQFLRRMKEASIRKILGISRSQLTVQYFSEALTFCVLALIAGLALAQVMLPAFNTLSGKQLSIDLLNDGGLMVALSSLILIMALMSGTYPALFLTSLNPVEAMKGKMRTGREGKGFRNGLVIFQFSASIVLILCTAIVFEQLQFVTTKNLGFDKDNLIVLNNAEVTRSREGLAEAIRALNGVSEVTRATSLPPYIWGGDTFTATGMNGKMFNMNFTSTEDHFLPAFGVKLLFGRNFNPETPADTGRVIVNVSTIQRIGWPVDENVIGKEIDYDNNKFQIIGVVADFNYWPLQTEIEPLGIFHMKSGRVVGEGSREFMGIRMSSLNPEQWQAMLGELQALWKFHAPDSPFEYQFVDDNFAKAFKTESQFGQALTVMAGLAILIASLGLLGMIVYSLELRTKEIGIRKVAGASVWNILTLISRSYTLLILTAFALGAPLSWWMMDKWLSSFAYRITPSPWLFAGVGIGTLIVAISITFYHSLKAALTNPVDVLKDE